MICADAANLERYLRDVILKRPGALDPPRRTMEESPGFRASAPVRQILSTCAADGDVAQQRRGQRDR